MFFLPAVGLQWRDKQHLKSGKVPLTLTQATLSCQEHVGSDVGIVLGDFFHHRCWTGYGTEDQGLGVNVAAGSTVVPTDLL